MTSIPVSKKLTLTPVFLCLFVGLDLLEIPVEDSNKSVTNVDNVQKIPFNESELP
jgi:hypothetical protein